jgi:hypothetical protein
VVGALNIVSTEWSADYSADYSPEAKKEFQRAVDGWRLALRVWNLKIREATASRNNTRLYDRPLIDAIEEYTGYQVVPIDDSGPPALRYSEAIRTVLGKASAHSQAARAFLATHGDLEAVR